MAEYVELELDGSKGLYEVLGEDFTSLSLRNEDGYLYLFSINKNKLHGISSGGSRFTNKDVKISNRLTK